MREASLANPDVRGAEEGVVRERNLVKGSFSDFFPQFSVDSSYNAGNVSSPSGALGVDISTRQEFEVGAAVRQNIFSGLKTRANYRKIKSLLEEAKSDLLGSIAQVSFELKSAFSRMLFAQERLTLAKEIFERRQENVQLVELRYEGGIENKGSFLRSQAQYEQAKFDVAQASRDVEAQETNLARVLGRPNPANQEIRVRGDFQTSMPEKNPDFQLKVLQNPNYQTSDAQLEGSKADITFVRGDLFPALDAAASVSRSEIFDQSSSNRWATGVVLSYPLLLGGRDIYEVKGAKADKRRAEENLRSVEYRVATDLKQAYADFKDAVENVRVQEEFLKAARLRSEISRKEYSNGLTNFFDWDAIENDLIQSETTALQSRRDALIAEAEWERVQGKGAW